MQRQLSDWGGNLAAYSLMIVLNLLSNTLPINNQSMPEVSAKYPSLFTPAGFTFSIWGVIYLALLIFLVYQAMPSQRDNATIAAISRPFQISCLANAGWILAWHYDFDTNRGLEASPIVVDGVVYLRNAEQAAAYRLPAIRGEVK